MIQEKCRGVQRAVNLRKKEQVWLARIFGELVAVEDSRVFRDQTAPGRPRVLAQKCGNRNGRFLVLEEYNDRGRCGSIFVPEGRDRQGGTAESGGGSGESSGKALTVMGDHAASGSVIKCLSVAGGKAKYVGEGSNCCAGCVSVGGRGQLLDYLEKLQVELFKCIGNLKLCNCCLQHGRQEDSGLEMLEATKEAQEINFDLNKGPEETLWTVVGKKQRRNKEKGLLPRPNSSWVSGRNGFGPVEPRKEARVHEGSSSGLMARLGHTGRSHSREKEAFDQPVFSTGEARTMTVVESPAVSLAVEVSATGAVGVGKDVSATSAQMDVTPDGVVTTREVEAPVGATASVEASTAGVGVITQGISVYRRREGKESTLEKGIVSSTAEGDSELCETGDKPFCVPLMSGLLEEDASRDGSAPEISGCGALLLVPLGESSTWSHDSGDTSEVLTVPVGVVPEELEVPAVVESEVLEVDLPLTMAVSNVVGLSSDGQEKLKEECFKQILAMG
ncbi:hypothetical protein FH972_012728 [Carpinus fangiana]|uniref:Uncharacterized protein n=1 Tax=Carpinus fangiana TaxID=176857 RepID=A0A5N6R4L3_9ROSI|nr:hypothetical protein FH972_012728 [Carpinus fangiana]